MKPTPIVDALDRPVVLPRPPQRVVSLVPSQTELLADLGLDAEVVGVTKFCVHPAHWRRQKAVVGGTKTVDCAAIAALRPDLVLVNKEENTQETVEALAAVAPVYVTDVHDLSGALAMIDAVGQLVDRVAQAAALVDEIEAAFAALPRFAPLRAAYLIWRGPYMAAGGGTFIDDMLTHGGFSNALGATPRYPEVTVETLRAAGLDRLLLSSEPFPFGPRHVEALSQALPGVRVALVDGELFSWFGSRIRATPAYLRRLRGA
jgi:ABC-type Fe3+-hydroxamate transport system substrate-binding protein